MHLPMCSGCGHLHAHRSCCIILLACCFSGCACCCSKEVVTKLQADLRQAQDADAAAARQLAVASQESSQLRAQLQQSGTHRQAKTSYVMCVTANDCGMSQHVCLTRRLTCLARRLTLSIVVLSTGMRLRHSLPIQQSTCTRQKLP